MTAKRSNRSLGRRARGGVPRGPGRREAREEAAGGPRRRSWALVGALVSVGRSWGRGAPGSGVGPGPRGGGQRGRAGPGNGRRAEACFCPGAWGLERAGLGLPVLARGAPKGSAGPRWARRDRRAPGPQARRAGWWGRGRNRP